MHLVVGAVVGIAVAWLAVTGSILALQPQIVRFAERSMRPSIVSPGTACVAPSELLRQAQLHSGVTPSALQVFADPGIPALVTLATPDQVLLSDACTGRILGPGATRLRVFFASVRDLHRWMALKRGDHDTLRSIKNAANFGFLLLMISGIVLWVPRQWRRANLQTALTLRARLRGRAREWNLHTVLGFWFTIPLLCISLSGSIMSYSWANALLYRVSGTPLPSAGGPERGGKGVAADLTRIDPLVAAAKLRDPRWRTLSFRLPSEKDKVLSITLDHGVGNQPQERGQLTLNLKSGSEVREVQEVRWEPFDSLPRGRRWRMYVRFLHTGEVFGLPGQLIALCSVLVAFTLVWTGFSLVIRRFSAWRHRKSRARLRQEALEAV